MSVRTNARTHAHTHTRARARDSNGGCSTHNSHSWRRENGPQHLLLCPTDRIERPGRGQNRQSGTAIPLQGSHPLRTHPHGCMHVRTALRTPCTTAGHHEPCDRPWKEATDAHTHPSLTHASPPTDDDVTDSTVFPCTSGGGGLAPVQQGTSTTSSVHAEPLSELIVWLCRWLTRAARTRHCDCTASLQSLHTPVGSRSREPGSTAHYFAAVL